MMIDLKERLKKYFLITGEAFEIAKKAPVNDKAAFDEIIDMVARYISDAKHFEQKGESLTAFAALNYAHGWLDCGARLKVFEVKDSRLFTVDE